MRKSIPLTADLVRAALSYDPETGLFHWLVKASYRVNVGDVAGAPNGHIGYVQIGLHGGRYYAHRLVWMHVHGEWPGDMIDHIDGDKTNNRLSNLRVLSNAENLQNSMRPGVSNLAGLRGVTTSNGRYFARIEAGGKSTYLGTFWNAEKAHAAYIAAKRKLHPAWVEPDAHLAQAKLREAVGQIGRRA